MSANPSGSANMKRAATFHAGSTIERADGHSPAGANKSSPLQQQTSRSPSVNEIATCVSVPQLNGAGQASAGGGNLTMQMTLGGADLGPEHMSDDSDSSESGESGEGIGLQRTAPLKSGGSSSPNGRVAFTMETPGGHGRFTTSTAGITHTSTFNFNSNSSRNNSLDAGWALSAEASPSPDSCFGLKRESIIMTNTASSDTMGFSMSTYNNTNSSLASGSTGINPLALKRGASMPPKGGRKEIKKFALKQEEVDEDKLEEEMFNEIERARKNKQCNFGKLNLSAFPKEFLTDSFVSILKELLLSENTIRTLPPEPFAAMKILEKLDLANNKLDMIPPTLLTLPALKVLLLDHNHLKALPFGEAAPLGPLLPSLEEIGLEWNDLQAFPMPLLTRCPKLTALYISENQKLYNEPPDTAAMRAAQRAPLPDGGIRPLTLKLVNSPRLVQLVEQEKWAERLPHITVEWSKIYPDKVLDFIYLGSVRTAQTIPVYQDLKINYILTAGRDLDVVLSDGMKHLELAVDDIPGENMIPLFKRAFAFIDEARAARQGVLIHCFAGLSRSVTITVAYLMKEKHMTRDQALELVRQSRPAAQPNRGFMQNLLQFEEQLAKRSKS